MAHPGRQHGRAGRPARRSLSRGKSRYARANCVVGGAVRSLARWRHRRFWLLRIFIVEQGIGLTTPNWPANSVASELICSTNVNRPGLYFTLIRGRQVPSSPRNLRTHAVVSIANDRLRARRAVGSTKSGSHKTRRWSKADPNRWSHLAAVDYDVLIEARKRARPCLG
jgi:hypothetical protein